MFVLAVASDFNGFLVGMAIGGLGFGMYVAVDLALVADVLPARTPPRISASSTSPARFPSPSRRRSRRPSWPSGSGSYGVLYAVGGVSAILGAVAILPVKRVR